MGFINKNILKRMTHNKDVDKKSKLETGDILLTKDCKLLLYISDQDWRTRFNGLCNGPKSKDNEGIFVIPSNSSVISQRYVDSKNYDKELKCKEFPNLDVVEVFPNDVLHIRQRDLSDWEAITSEYKRRF